MLMVRCLLLGWMIAGTAAACTCSAPPPPPCEYIGSLPVFLAAAESGTGEAFATGRMRVLERFQGNPPDTFEAWTDGMCAGPAPASGHVYLLYQAADFSKPVNLGGCGRSSDVKYAREDLNFWREYVKGKTRTTIRGTVGRDLDKNAKDYKDAKKLRPMKDVPVLIRSMERTYRAKTNARGEYSVANAVPGEYTIEPALDGYQANGFGGNTGSLSTGGCIVRDFTMHVDRSVRGILRDAEGAPAAGVTVNMILTDQKAAEESQQALYATTEADGSFAIERIWPGSYYLGVNMDRVPSPQNPYPPTYYPGTPERRLASPIVFTVVPRSHTLEFRLPPREE